MLPKSENQIVTSCRFRIALFVLSGAVGLVLGACSGTTQVQRALKYESFELQLGDLEDHGLAFITPTSVTGQEQDRQSVAFLFARVLEEERPDVPVTSLAETLGAINEAGFLDEYKQMFAYYKDTGILPADVLKKIAQVTGRRYIAMLQMAAYSNTSSGRVRIFGVRFVVTKSATLRLFNQIWDSETGKIAWEANQEITVSYETAAETVVTFETMVEYTAKDLVTRLPHLCPQGDDITPEELEACTPVGEDQGVIYSAGEKLDRD
jgi:hypothetical protein